MSCTDEYKAIYTASGNKWVYKLQPAKIKIRLNDSLERRRKVILQTMEAGKKNGHL